MTTRIDDNLLLDGAIVTCRHCGTILGDDHDPIRNAVVRESEPSEAGPGVRAAATNFATRRILLRRAFCPSCLVQLKFEIVPADEGSFRSSRVGAGL